MASIKIVLRKKKLSNGIFPVYLRVTKDRKTKYFKTLFNASPDEWDSNSELFTKKNKNYIQNNRLLINIKNKAYKVYSELQIEKERFTLIDFENQFRVKANPHNQNFFYFWHDLMSDMITEGRTGNARCHNDSFNALKRFHGSTRLKFEQITVSFLYKYETFLRSRGGTDGGINIRMRAIRIIFNAALRRDMISVDLYPFNKYKISKLKAKSAKRALDMEEVHKIVYMDISKDPQWIDSHNYFVFSFYTRGMNFADMMRLKWQDITHETINYTRSKTKGNFRIKIVPPVRTILEFYYENSLGTEYVFPILLRDNLSPMQIENRKKKMLTKFNRELKEIAAACGIEKTLTSYVARHSFANCLKQKGVPTDVISESLGHQNIAVTQAYLKELDSSVLDKAVEILL